MREMGEGMRELKDLIQYRKYHPTLGWGDHEGGFFVVLSPLQKSQNMAVVASIGGGWDQVSVSLGNRCPTWREMDYIKRLFFKPDEAGYLAGLFDGEGSFSKGNSGKNGKPSRGMQISFAQQNNSCFEKGLEILKLEGYDVNVHTHYYKDNKFEPVL